MGKIVIVLLATLFICGIISHYVPASQQAALGNGHGISWLFCIGAVAFVGSWKLLGK